MPRTVDVSGLSAEAVRAVESPVGLLRRGGQGENGPRASIFDLFGRALTPRSAADIARQVRGERDARAEP